MKFRAMARMLYEKHCHERENLLHRAVGLFAGANPPRGEEFLASAPPTYKEHPHDARYTRAAVIFRGEKRAKLWWVSPVL